MGLDPAQAEYLMQLELREVSKKFGEHTALHPTSLVFEEGRTTVLIGPSGCGKSTILRLLIGLLEPTTGEVLVSTENTPPPRSTGGVLEPGEKAPPLTLAGEVRERSEASQSLDAASSERGGGGAQNPTSDKPQATSNKPHPIGYVIQDGGLFPHLTARDNVALAARYFGVSKGEIDQRIKDLSDLVHLQPDLLTRYPLELSGGQRQRIGLMRALMLKPKALLLDEPLGALDPMVRSTLQTDLKDIFAKLGQTVVFVTHDMGEAGYLGDRIVLLKEGRIVQSGTLQDFQQRPAEPFVTEFLNAQRSLVSL
jgi:osmoprotectant transport system ATP-binding protein